MVITERYLVVLFVLGAGLAVFSSAADASPSDRPVRQSAADAVGDLGTSTVPVDPIIEEPLRPLLPESRVLEPTDFTQCGSLGGFMLPGGLLLMQGMGWISHRRRD